MLSSYVKVWNLGHKAVESLFCEPVIVEEKVDGSQFSFGLMDGVLEFRSHNCEVFPEHAGMFQLAVENVNLIKDLLHPGWKYRVEFLSKPKHNILEYERVPKLNLIIFDIDTGIENYLPYEEKKKEAERIGLEVVPQLDCVISIDGFTKLLETVSILGKTTIEGVVIKNYHRFDYDGHCLMGKYVSEKFKEKLKDKRGEVNPGQRDIINSIGQQLKTDARWNKGIQHLREQELIEDTPADIGKILHEVSNDIEVEEKEAIKNLLYAGFRKQILRVATAGLPEFYKKQLLEKQLK